MQHLLLPKGKWKAQGKTVLVSPETAVIMAGFEVVPLVPVDEETGLHGNTWTDRGKCCKKAVLGALAVAVLGLCVGHAAYTKLNALNELTQPSVTSDLGAVGIKQDVGTFGNEILEEDWPVLKKEIKREQSNPAGCFAKLSFASAWSASLGLKLMAATKECNPRNYRDDPTPFRRLHEVHQVPGLPQEAAVHYPTSPWAQYKESVGPVKDGEKDGGIDIDGLAAEAAYNLTEGVLRLKTRFAFGKRWTMEGWHYMKEHHPGCVWDTRRNENAPGLRLCFTGNGLLAIDVFAPHSPGMTSSVIADVATPLSTWVHLAMQRSGPDLEFFMDGKLGGKAPVPAGLTDELLPQSRVRLGGSVDGDPHRKFRGMVSNMRLTSDALYNKSEHFDIDPNLDQLLKTRFLLKSHFMDAVSGRRMRKSGNVTTRYDAEILMDTWKAEGLIDDNHNFTPPMNMTRVEVLRRLFPFEDPIYKTEFLGAFCARVVLQILKEITTIEDRLMDAVPLCDATATSPQCYKAVSYAFRQAVSIGRYGAELEPRCVQTVNEDFRGDFRCSERLEGLSWALDGFGSQIAKARRICHDNDLSSPLLDLGACVGESLSATGYMFASALLLESALGFDCPNPEFDDERPLTETLQLTCARDSTAIFRTTFLAGSKAVRAAGHCGGTDTLCGRSILRSAAALSGVGETGVFLRVFCHGPTPCCEKNPDTDEVECECEPEDLIENKRDDKDDQKQCARFGGSTVKLLGSAALAATEAEGQCKFSKTAESTCQTSVPAAIAGLGFFIENGARASRDCPPRPYVLDPEERRKDLIVGPADPRNFYQCGQNVKRLGVSMDVIARGIAGAVVNCPYGDLSRVTKPVKSARRFFTP